MRLAFQRRGVIGIRWQFPGSLSHLGPRRSSVEAPIEPREHRRMARRKEKPPKRSSVVRQRRWEVLPPYTVLPHGWRHPSWWLAPALSVFCFFFGAFYAITTPYLIMPMMVPIAILLGFVIWALPDQRKGPEGALWPLLCAYVVALVMWPNYLSIDLPGLPWISILRLIGAPMTLALLIAFS